MVRRDSLARRRELPALRLSERPGAAYPLAGALSLSGLPQGFLGQDGHAHARVQSGPSDLGDRHLPADDQPQGRVLDEAASRHRRDTEDRMVSDPSHSRDLDRGYGVAVPGPVEVDETYIGGKMSNMHSHKKREARQRPDYGKSIVVGAKDRDTNRVSARVVECADKPTLHGFVGEKVAEGASVKLMNIVPIQG